MPRPDAPRFHGVAIDAGSGLAASIKAARGAAAHPDDLLVFKAAVPFYQRNFFIPRFGTEIKIS